MRTRTCINSLDLLEYLTTLKLVQINIAGKQLHLGFFGTEEQAARAYDRYLQLICHLDQYVKGYALPGATNKATKESCSTAVVALTGANVHLAALP